MADLHEGSEDDVDVENDQDNNGVRAYNPGQRAHNRGRAPRRGRGEGRAARNHHVGRGGAGRGGVADKIQLNDGEAQLEFYFGGIMWTNENRVKKAFIKKEQGSRVISQLRRSNTTVQAPPHGVNVLATLIPFYEGQFCKINFNDSE